MIDSKENSSHSKRMEIAATALFALLAIAVVLYVRLRLLGMPLERDEGEYAYSGQLILKGFPPYLHAYTMKLPGMAYLSALFMLCFGVSIQGMHLGLLVSNIASAALIFLIARKLFGAAAGAAAAAVFLLMTISQHLLGAFAHATHFIVLFVLAASYLIVSKKSSLSRSRLITAGLFLGSAFLIKQHAALFLISSLVFILLDSGNLRKRLGSGLLLLSGFFAPYLLILLILFKQGVFRTFWLWTVSYASVYATGLTPLLGWMNFKSQMADILGSTWPYWGLAAAGFLLLLISKQGKSISFIIPLAICSLIAICPGFHFRPHYFILLPPAVALTVGSLLAKGLLPKAARVSVIAALIAASMFQLWQERWFLFAATPQEYLKKAYQTTKPFVESAAVADYVKTITSKNDRILVLGSEPQIYFYADRLSATGHIYMYPLMEEQPYALRMQEEMLQQISQNRPACLILVDDLSSWLSVSTEGERFRERLSNFMENRYELEGVASVSRENESFYVFGERAQQFIPDSASRILLYRLKKGASGE
jgi:4-amino-4-deoxy-L-arabinose transferase-like glycosyltransferase